MQESHQQTYTTFTLTWDLPEDSGPEENYTITVMPSIDPPIPSVIPNPPPFMIDLPHNVFFNVSLTVVNCAGESEAEILRINIGMAIHSKLVILLYYWL